jgi:hypothetical protein
VARCSKIEPPVVGDRLDRKAAAFLARWTEENIAADERERFREVAENDRLGLHEGNFARYQIRPAQFAARPQGWGKSRRRHQDSDPRTMVLSVN